MEQSKYFIGQAQTAIDGKGRTAFPREFRRQLSAADGSEFVVTRGPDRTLRLYVLAEYEKFLDDLSSWQDRRQADIVRRGLWEAFVSFDTQNRILLPKRLLDYARLEGEVLYLGATKGKVLELWNPDRYYEQYGAFTDDSAAAFDEAFYGSSSTGVDNGGK